MNYIFGNECEKAVQEYINLKKDYKNERLWAIKHNKLYKKIYVKNDKLETDLTITKVDMNNTLDFIILYQIYNFKDDSEDNLFDVVLV
mgnify:CR=1 FL=1